jgi:hypothetical protein
MYDFFSIGLPTDSTQPLYALYSFALDRFLLTEPNVKVATKTASLMYPKIDLRVVKISDANNYYHNIVDNTIVENWSYTTSDFFVNLRANLLDTVTPEHLTNKTLQDEDKKRVLMVKDWTIMCAFWIRFLEGIRTHILLENLPAEFYETFIGEEKFVREYHTLEKKIYHELFVGLDYNTTVNNVRQIAASSDIMNKRLINEFNYPEVKIQ